MIADGFCNYSGIMGNDQEQFVNDEKYKLIYTCKINKDTHNVSSN